MRELDERFGLSELIGENLVDPRTGRNRQFPLADLLRQSVYSRLAGYEDLNDAVRVSADPTFRLMGSEKVWERGVIAPRIRVERGRVSGRVTFSLFWELPIEDPRKQHARWFFRHNGGHII